MKGPSSRVRAIGWLMAALSLVGWLIVNLDTAGWILLVVTVGLMVFELTRRPPRRGRDEGIRYRERSLPPHVDK